MRISALSPAKEFGALRVLYYARATRATRAGTDSSIIRKSQFVVTVTVFILVSTIFRHYNENFIELASNNFALNRRKISFTFSFVSYRYDTLFHCANEAVSRVLFILFHSRVLHKAL